VNGTRRLGSGLLAWCLSSCAPSEQGAGDTTLVTASSDGPVTRASSDEGTSDTPGSTATTQAGATTGHSEPRRVLFLGNSYTFVNDLPAMVAAMGDASGDPLLVDVIAIGGATVADHVANPQVAATLAEGWDVVIVQGQSVEPITAPTVFVQAVVDLAAMLEASTPEADMILFETWARRQGDPLLAELGMTAEQMQEALTAGYADAAAAGGASISPVGQAWGRALLDAPPIELFAADGSHPALAGTFLASCVFFGVLTGNDAADNDHVVEGIASADAEALASIADSFTP
jgi:hypothetical protein